MDEGMKVGFLFFGMFFYLLALVVEQVNRVNAWLLGQVIANMIKSLSPANALIME